MNIKVAPDGVVIITAVGQLITKDVALTEEHFHANPCKIEVGPRNGVKRFTEDWRRNGKTQTWKTRPDEWRVPIKYGLKSYDQLTPGFNNVVHAASECPLRDVTDVTVIKWAVLARHANLPLNKPSDLTTVVSNQPRT